MDHYLWILAGLAAFALAYSLQFSSVTLSMGRELDDTGSPCGFQDAISPPWQTNFGLGVFLACAVIVGLMWWEMGVVSGLGGMALIFVGSSIARLALPDPKGCHYRGLIMRSMISRYANYVRDGDRLRAEAMKQLLIKAGFDPSQFEKA